jgi:hypothetical protein
VVETLSRLESLRGKPSRTFISVALAASEVGARWPCGCVARGPTFSALEINPLACQIHLPKRSKVTQTIVLPDDRLPQRQIGAG